MNWDLVTIFTFVIILVSVRRHYRYLDRAGPQISAADQAALAKAMETGRRLESRIETLERLLDEDAPGWRARSRS